MIILMLHIPKPSRWSYAKLQAMPSSCVSSLLLPCNCAKTSKTCYRK